MTGSPGDFDRIELRDVSRHFGRRRALSRISLTCQAGDLVGLVGPNGAGKSTLLSVLATLTRPTNGTVHYGDRPASDLGDALRSRIGVLGHDLFLYADLTARENLEFFGELYGVAPLTDRVNAALAAAQLEDRAEDRVSSFSRGMRQRLALERALLHQPRLVLLDEPFTGLDEASAARLVERLRALRSSGAIVLMATHDFEHADGLIDRMICLRDGKAREIGGSGHVRDRYRAAISEVWS